MKIFVHLVEDSIIDLLELTPELVTSKRVSCPVVLYLVHITKVKGDSGERTL